MSDKLVYDLTQETEGSPNIFIRKDWLSIMDNMNGSYQSNQSVIDTSQIANANKWMNYREAYLSVPMLLTMTTPAINGNNGNISDGSIGLKNWFGSIIHSLTVDYNGSTIIQQTPFINMWNSFKLITSLSYNDLITQGAVMGFYPDTAGSWTYDAAAVSTIAPNYSNCDIPFYDCESGVFGNSSRYLSFSVGGAVVGNAVDVAGDPAISTVNAGTIVFGGNVGLSKRIKWITFNDEGGDIDGVSSKYTTFGMTKDTAKNIWKSHVSKKVKPINGVDGVYQVSVMATIYLKHLCSFFDMCPLLKGVFMKLTLNLNNSSSTITRAGGGENIKSYTSNIPSGGVQPLLIPSARSLPQNIDVYPGGDWITEYSLSVGNKCLNNNHSNIVGVEMGKVANNIYLNVPAYSFTPTFEEAYLASSPKKITYTDVYQYQITNEISANSGTFNSLITNGLRNIKSVLIIPFINTSVIGDGKQQFSSPFDPAGCGTTAPMVHLNNLQVQIGGQNALYNAQKYNYEEFIHQLQGANAVNGGMTDGLTSGLIGYDGFQQSYCYYYVNVERMLPVEKNVSKSVYISGNNSSTQAISLWVFVEYETEITIDLYTGARI